MTKDQLLAEFPDYKPTVYHVDMDNNIDPIFTYWDRVELEGMLLERENGKRKQMELFI